MLYYKVILSGMVERMFPHLLGKARVFPQELITYELGPEAPD